MSEFRRNPFTGEWTLYAQNRKQRPYQFQWRTVNQKEDMDCPFCIGNEARTTPAIYQDGVDGAWHVRVFPNMYPAVDTATAQESQEMFYEQVIGGGQHEVLVDTPKHGQTIDQLSCQEIFHVLQVLQMRYESIRAKPETKYVQIFKNCGAEAGMSIQHSHWQIIGVPIVPERIRKMIYLGMRNGCKFCDMLAYEQQQRNRIAAENTEFLAIAPYASRFPYELWVLPKAHMISFAELHTEHLQQLSALLHDILPKVKALRANVGYNICLMDAPKSGENFHWHLQILPRIGGFAGFEHATDCFINTVYPEDAAAYYQQDIEEKES